MARADFYVIYIERDPDISYEQIRKTMDLARNWYRVTSRYWIVYTTSDAVKWYSRLKNFVKDSGNVFICKLDIAERQGWMSREFWNWLHELEGSKVSGD